MSRLQRVVFVEYVLQFYLNVDQEIQSKREKTHVSYSPLISGHRSHKLTDSFLKLNGHGSLIHWADTAGLT